MRSMMCRVAVLAAGLTALAPAPLVVRAADEPAIVSAWKTQDVQIDGRADEWTSLTAIPKGPSVQALNDDHSLYLAIVTSDRTVRRTLAPGFVVWLDASGSKNADVGLQLPGAYTLQLGAKAGATPQPGSDPPPPAAIDEIDWLGPGKRRRLVSITPESGIALASGTEASQLVYELELPLAASTAHPFAVGAAPGRTIAIGLFTPEVPKLPRKRDGGPTYYDPSDPYDPNNPNGYSGPYGYGGIGVTGVPPPMVKGEPEPEKPPTMKVWFRLELARK